MAGKVFSCDVCIRTFHEDAYTHCRQCHDDIQAVNTARQKLAPLIPKLWRMSCLDAARWAIEAIVKRMEKRHQNRT